MRPLTAWATCVLLVTSGSACTSSDDPDATDVRIELTNPVLGLEEMGPFEATGGAVDDGVICARGQGALMTTEDTADGGVRADYEFRCDDGTGTFEVQVQVTADIVSDQSVFEQAVDGVLDLNVPWIVLTGDGEFTELEGDGMYGWTAVEAGNPQLPAGTFGVFEGDVTLPS
jgi:hypothetical protein